jgi:UDP-4-amino-4,6-dideoxy-N-acetyl-beta-L-altrosamine N-acetyltransferase
MGLFQFKKLEEQYVDIIFKWRTDKEVSKFLFTEIPNNIEYHKQWFNKIIQDQSYKYWVINYNNTPIGIVNLASIDRINLRVSAGYYIGEMKYRSLGALPLPYLYNYVFKEMKFKKIYGEVIADNKNVLLIHEMHGYRKVGIYKDHIYKDGKFHDVILVELMADTWLNQKRYKTCIADFDN